ncbi:MAG: alpha/beta fold hydrolase [Firmicutes bacterium]|nr:alpha/beta fold hydrolase [Bacillota bacterium]
MISEKIIVGAGGDFPLDGLLTLPEGAEGPVPAAVMVHGSGASNMDEKVMKLTPFKDLAEGLAERGIGSLRYDKRTFAYRKKLAKTDITAWEETVEDALRAVELLKKDRRVDPERVFILGHSMGAMLAPRIDAEGANARGLVMMAGTPYRLEDIMKRQLKQSQSGRGLVRLIMGIEDRIFSKKFDGMYEMSDEEAKKKKFSGAMSLYYFKEMGKKTAADYLLESEKPVFIMQGERDFQVLADVDFARFKELLADRGGTEFKLYPGLDHAFVPALYGDITKAAKEFSVERHIGSEVMDDIAAFIKRV